MVAFLKSDIFRLLHSFVVTLKARHASAKHGNSWNRSLMKCPKEFYSGEVALRVVMQCCWILNMQGFASTRRELAWFSTDSHEIEGNHADWP